jgi:PemK-like, MazF-like toxin of type II toxin-antitoxin system
MARSALQQVLDLLAKMFGSGRSTTKPPRSTAKPSRSTAPPAKGAGASDVHDGDYRFEYAPELDGDPDPGEVVWTWVPYEDDPRQGKDRPVAIIGRHGRNLLGVALTSKDKHSQFQVPVGTGPWDRQGRPSYAKVDRLLDVDPGKVRREGAILGRSHHDEVVAAVRRLHERRR